MVHDLTTQKGRNAYAKMVENHQFTVQDGIRVQTEQLAQWAKVLKPEIHESLVIHATAKNHEAEDGYGIVRGSRLPILIERMINGNLEILKKTK
jgi:hypothetical protein